MRKFETLDGVAAPWDAANTDTDQIIPARYIWRARADGYGHLLFHDLRTTPEGTPREGTPRAGFVLDRPEYKGAAILVADRNFGCGSSREAAVWTLMDAGFGVVVAPSFGDIFRNNCLKQGLLPVALPEARCAELRAALARNPGARLVVDLERQTVTGPVGVNDGYGVDHFEIDAFRRMLLLAGQDDIAFTRGHDAAIARFEEGYARDMPWL